MIFSTAPNGISDGVHYELMLEKGPYIAEKEDANGTYYRAPPGALSRGPYMAWGQGGYHDNPGGFWVPHNHDESPRIYLYRIEAASPAIQNPVDYGDCSSYSYAEDPKTKGIDLVSLSVGGALGGATARMAAPGSRISYGQAAVGSAAGMLIVGAIINADVGKIYFDVVPLSQGTGPQFATKLKELADQAVVLKKVPLFSENSNGTVPADVDK